MVITVTITHGSQRFFYKSSFNKKKKNKRLYKIIQTTVKNTQIKLFIII